MAARLADHRDLGAGGPAAPDAERHAEGEGRPLDTGLRLDAIDGALQERHAAFRACSCDSTRPTCATSVCAVSKPGFDVRASDRLRTNNSAVTTRPTDSVTWPMTSSAAQRPATVHVGAFPLLQRRRERGARPGERREDTAGERGRHDHGERQADEPPVERGVELHRQRQRQRHPRDRRHGQQHERQASGGAERRQAQRLDEVLLDEPASRGAERGPHGELFLAHGVAREQEAGDVGARDAENEPADDDEHAEEAPDAARARARPSVTGATRPT